MIPPHPMPRASLERHEVIVGCGALEATPGPALLSVTERIRERALA